jgi:hypothetical protein
MYPAKIHPIPETTASLLGSLHAELVAAGFDPEQAFEVVMVYVRENAPEGFCVKAEVSA